MPILDDNTFEFFSRSVEQTHRFGMRLGSMLSQGDVLCLNGDLGSGKTTLVQGIAKGWGSLDQVTSPTFVIVNTYRRPDGIHLYHLDAYRLQNSQEAEDLDLEEMLENGVLVVEWADQIRAALPEDVLQVQFTWLAEEQRLMRFTAASQHYQDLIRTLRTTVYGV